MTYEPEAQVPELPHKLTLEDRNRLLVTGVTEVESFDEELAVLHTTKGVLVIRGQALHLQLLSLEGGQVHVDGKVVSLTYEDGTPQGSWLSRLFG